ncbi:hypothetical protein M404DRAFT_25046 [Pisolithus tinctorius Marx 270]|uniref:Uncharacterized protein n=1 Tax=Pisolithus tinctorius Marx 270 TaxID=870435 RepID=A0A0C3NY27_PISTI|nr:hypothetical protein M404DRAFT_25046 [Pisolithus tinctorius Marx 270]
MTCWSLVHSWLCQVLWSSCKLNSRCPRQPPQSLANLQKLSGLFQGAWHLGLPLPTSALHLATPGYPSLSVSLPAYTVLASGCQPTSWMAPQVISDCPKPLRHPQTGLQPATPALPNPRPVSL